MKIMISGGHLTPALAFIDYAQKQQNVELVFIGREFSQMKTKQPSVEHQEVTKRGVKFIPFHSGKLHQPNFFDFLRQLIAFFQGLGTAHQIIRSERPDLFLSFGGYLAVPIALTAKMHGIPVVTHEQTRAAGVANRLIALFATKVAISYPESQADFPSSKTVLTGNPIRPVLMQTTKRPEWLPAKLPKPLLYITGGSQGSELINRLTSKLLPQLTQEWVVIHQCGKTSATMNAANMLNEHRSALPPQQQTNYFIREWVSEEELAWIYHHVQLIISRAGGNTVQEITFIAKPAIFIPLAFAHRDEQRKNAESLVQTGSAMMLLQQDATPENLLALIQTCQKNYDKLGQAAKENAHLVIKDADHRLFDLITTILTKQ